MADLKTDYKDDVLDTSVNSQRKYRMITNDDGTVSFEDVTEYSQVGDSFGSADVNAITKKLTDDVLDTKEEIEANNEENKIAGALAVKEVIEEVNNLTCNTGDILLSTNQPKSTTELQLTIPNYADYNVLRIVIYGDLNLGGLALVIPKVFYAARTPFIIDASSVSATYNFKTSGYFSNGALNLKSLSITGWQTVTISVAGYR